MAAKRTKSLKDRLIDATIRGIEKVGVENLSLRKIAADCGEAETALSHGRRGCRWLRQPLLRITDS